MDFCQMSRQFWIKDPPNHSNAMYAKTDGNVTVKLADEVTTLNKWLETVDENLVSYSEHFSRFKIFSEHF